MYMKSFADVSRDMDTAFFYFIEVQASLYIILNVWNYCMIIVYLMWMFFYSKKSIFI